MPGGAGVASPATTPLPITTPASIEEPTTAEARPFLELHLGPLVVDGETTAPHRWSARTLVSPSLPLRPMAMDEQERWDRAGSGREEAATEQAKVAKVAKDANAPRGRRDESCERYGR